MSREFKDYIVVVDVETTGLNPNKHSIVSIGAVNFSNPENQFYRECRVFDGAEVSAEALEVNGFSLEQINDKSKKSLKEILEDFLVWSGSGKVIAGENPSFDANFLKVSLGRYGMDANVFGHRMMDLHTLCFEHYLKHGLIIPTKNGFPSLGLDKSLAAVGLPSEPNPHNALTGAKMEAEAFSRFLYGKNFLKEFEVHKIPHYFQK